MGLDEHRARIRSIVEDPSLSYRQRVHALAGAAEETNLVRVRFVAADGRRAAGHAAKAVKGQVARTVVTKGAGALSRFSWEGWRARRHPDGYELIAPG